MSNWIASKAIDILKTLHCQKRIRQPSNKLLSWHVRFCLYSLCWKTFSLKIFLNFLRINHDVADVPSFRTNSMCGNSIWSNSFYWKCNILAYLCREGFHETVELSHFSKHLKILWIPWLTGQMLLCNMHCLLKLYIIYI